MSLLADALDDDVTRHALSQLRAARRKNRVQNLDFFDAFYKAYVTALFSIVGVYTAAGAFGDQDLTSSELATLRADGAQWIGLFIAFAVAVGLRSGGRGGPLAFEQAEVRHVLLSPVDRRYSIRRPAMRQLRYVLFLGSSFGGAFGLVAARRMPDHPAEWIVSGMVLGAGMAAISYGAACIAGGYRFRSWLSDLLAIGVLAWSAFDIYVGRETSPWSLLGQVGIWPLEFTPLAFVGILISASTAAWGMGVINRSSIEAAERRSRLVGQLRFAATLQDIRTVMVLQRQLAQEQLRQRPWIRLPPSKYVGFKRGRVFRRVFFKRDLQGVLRWPFMRLARLLIFGAIAAASLAGVWAGTGPLVVVAGLAMWMAALDLCEPLAQEVDHPDRLKSMAQHGGIVLVQHLFVPYVLLICLAFVATAPFFIWGDLRIVVALWPLYVLVAGCALGGATLAINAKPPSSVGMLDTPETASVKFIWRVMVPPAIAVVAFLPIVAAHNAWERTHDYAEMVASTQMITLIATVLMVMSLSWLRYADQFRDAMATSHNPSSPSNDSKSSEKADVKNVNTATSKTSGTKSKNTKKKGRKKR